MAGQVSKQELGTVLVQAMLAQKNIRTQRERLLELLRRLQQQLSPSDNYVGAGLKELALDVEHIDLAIADRLHELAVKQMDIALVIKHIGLVPDIFKVYFIGIEAGARYLTSCLQTAAENGARLALNPAFGVMPDEELYDALLAQRLPARPTTQAEAFSRIEAAFYAVKLSQEHHLPRCIGHLTGEPWDESSEDVDDPVAAAAEQLARTGLSDPATVEPAQAADNRSVDVEKARDYLDRACTLASLAVKHIDLAVDVISSFLDPKEVASLSEYTDRAAVISEDQFLQFT